MIDYTNHTYSEKSFAYFDYLLRHRRKARATIDWLLGTALDLDVDVIFIDVSELAETIPEHNIVELLAERPAMVGWFGRLEDRALIFIFIDRIESSSELAHALNHEMIHAFQERLGGFLFAETTEDWAIELKEEIRDDLWQQSWWEFEAYMMMSYVAETRSRMIEVLPSILASTDTPMQLFDLDPDFPPNPTYAIIE